MCDVFLERGLTNVAVREYLESDARMASLADCLVDETVLGDTLINAIDQHGTRQRQPDRAAAILPDSAHRHTWHSRTDAEVIPGCRGGGGKAAEDAEAKGAR